MKKLMMLLLLVSSAIYAATPIEIVQLAELVAKTTPEVNAPQQRIVLSPKLIRFQASLMDGPKAQKADYLNEALAMMRVKPQPKVSQRIVLGYLDAKGAQRNLSVYIEDSAALTAKALKIGEQREFTALHVYNYSRGPALLIMGFGAGQ